MKIISNKPSITLVENEHLNSKNLTAHFHKAEYIEIEKKLISSNLEIKSLKDLVTKISLGNTGKIMDGYTSDGVPYLTTKNVTENGVDLSKLTFISSEIHNKKLKNSKVYPKDIIYNKSGNVGLSAIIPIDYEEYNLVSDLIYIRPVEKKINPYYLVLYLNSNVGKKLSEKQAGGAIFQHISIYDVGDLQVPVPHKRIQDYFGNKVLRAEQLQAEAKLLKVQVDNYITEYLKLDLLKSSIQSLEVERKWNIVKIHELHDRLDSEYYKKKYSILQEHLKQLKKLNIKVLKLKDVIKKGSYGILPSSHDYGKGDLAFIRSTDLEDYMINLDSCEKVPMKYNLEKARVSSGEILLEIKGAISGGAIVHEDIYEAIVNGSIYKFSVKDEFNNYYILAILQSLIGELQKEKYGANSVISYLSLDVIQNLQIPVLDRSIQDQIGAKLERFVQSQIEAKMLIKSANFDVESLIEGTFDESTIIDME